ncbi:MAG: hypothetical protein L3J91_04505, partial [Thermoplasmata archaeon]|nr:hypothetical protein [Thermoplasmata archaeon]
MSRRRPRTISWDTRATRWSLAIAVPGLLLLLTVPTGIGASAFARAAALGSAQTTSPYVCPFTTTESASARYVPLPAPSSSLAAGDSLTATFEFEESTWSTHSVPLHLTVPSFFAKFPLANGTDLSFYLPPRSLTIANGSWTDPALATKTKVMTGPVAFSGAKAIMTSELFAVMGDAAYQTVSIAFRWDWNVTFASNATTVTSAWSPVKIGGAHPTTFYPAPTVQLNSTSNKTVPIGATFSTYLTGAISQTAFHSVLEYASTGNVIRNTPTQTPVGNSTPDLVAVTILPNTGPLSPTTLLDHVRNVCGALLFSLSLKAVYAPSANVSFQLSPTTCGPIVFNGTAYTNGALLSTVPSSTSLSLSVGSCTGHTFQRWGVTGGFWATSGTSSSTSGTVSASGTVT